MEKKTDIKIPPMFSDVVRNPKTGAIISVTKNINPQPKQMEFFEATQPVVAYGGARGGGKTWAARGKAVALCLAYPDFKALIVRRTLDELKANHIEPLLKDLAPVLGDNARRGDLAKGKCLCVYSKEDKAIYFANGAKLCFGYCDTEDDVRRYQGQEYDVVFIDEATQLTEYQYQKISEICRGINDYPKRIYLTCNPGGIGHGWVKRLFIDRTFYENEDPEDYYFIQAKLEDNQILMKTSPDYRKRLDALPEAERKADRDGDWNVFEGVFFKEFDPSIHVVDSMCIPGNWNIYRSLDYGFDMLACYWHAVKPNGDVVTYREIHVPDLLPSVAAKMILEATPSCEKVIFTYAPPDLWARTKDRGKSVVEQFFDAGLRDIAQSDNNRVAGWLDMKEWMKICTTPTGERYSRYTITRECKNLVRNIPLAQADEKNPSDMSKNPHSITHAPDAVRYFFRSRPAPIEVPYQEINIFDEFHGRKSNTDEYGGMTYDGYGEVI